MSLVGGLHLVENPLDGLSPILNAQYWCIALALNTLSVTGDVLCMINID